MPSIASEHPCALASPRKRRRDDDGTPYAQPHAGQPTTNPQVPGREKQTQPQLSDRNCRHDICPQEPGDFRFDGSLPLFAYQPVNALRKTIPMPSAKRHRYVDEHDSENRPPAHHEQHHAHKMRKHSRSPSHTSTHTTPHRPAQPVRTNTATLLDPCHICRRKPTKKSDLDSFAACQGCEARTCFVCLRECQGWSVDAHKNEDGDGDVDIAEQEALSRSFHMTDAGDEPPARTTHGGAGWAAGEHKAVVCSQCCIEKGANGDIVCLGCLARIGET